MVNLIINSGVGGLYLRQLILGYNKAKAKLRNFWKTSYGGKKVCFVFFVRLIIIFKNIC